MIDNQNIQQKIATILREAGNLACVEKAKILELESQKMYSLHLRNLGLSSSNLISIVTILKEVKDNSIQSISFSYNRLLGDFGAIAITENVPPSICEVGLVDCGIGDVGGMALLGWIKTLPNLRMICIEQNNFSDKTKQAFLQFSNAHSHILVVV